MVEQRRDIQNSLLSVLLSDRFIMDVRTTTKTINICVMNNNIDFWSIEPIDVSTLSSKLHMMESLISEGHL
jgi:hypothetical protein